MNLDQMVEALTTRKEPPMTEEERLMNLLARVYEARGVVGAGLFKEIEVVVLRHYGRWGAVVNGRPTHTGPCHACRGTGKQDERDMARNRAFNRFQMSRLASTEDY